jgi:signal transduction histidine kinase
MSFGRDTASRDYDASDLLVAEELAVRAALAIDNAMLYRDVQEAVQLRDAFFSIASHELKTPLTSLLGQAQLLQRRLTQADAAPERNQRSIQVILDQAQRLNKLLATLLDVSRLSLGQMIVAHEPLDLHALIQQVVGNFQHDLEHHTLIYRASGQPFVVLGDMMRLEQVFQNLVQNAVKYSPQGGQIVVQAERRIDQVVISVIDHGIGIAAHELGNLFQRFYRVNNAAVQHINGMGIGLYIVKEIVTAHGGEVMVRSVEGQGSTFVVSLPLAEGAAEGVEGYAQPSILRFGVG